MPILKLVLICGLFIHTPAAFGQQIKSETLVFSNPRVFTPLGEVSDSRSMVCRFEAEDFWLIHNSVEMDETTNSCYFRLENLSTRAEFKLMYPCDSLFRPHVVEFFVEEDRIILVDLVKLIVFNRNNSSQWQLKHIVSLPATVLYCEKVSNTLHFWADVCSSHKLPNSCFYTFSYRLEDKAFIDQLEIDSPQGASRMFGQPRNVVDRRGDVVLCSDVSNYTIKLMTHEGAMNDSIVYEPVEWIQSESEVVIRPGVKLQKHFPTIDSLLKNTSSIRRVELLASDLILVLWESPGETGAFLKYADVWRKNGEHWDLAETALNYLDDSRLTTQPYGLKVKPLQSSYVYDDGFFIETIAAPPGEDMDKKWRSYSEYQAESDKYYIDNPLRYVVLVREFDDE